MKSKPLYVQMWTLRDEIEADLDGTSKIISDIGYMGVEPIGMANTSHEEQSVIYKKHQLKVLSYHAKGSDLIDKNLHNLIKYAKAYGAKYILAATPPDRNNDFKTKESIINLALAYNRSAKIVAEHGLIIGHHNHDWEFEKLGNQYGLEIFMNHLDAEVVVQLDVYWARLAGADPIAILKKYGHKIPLLHIKDGSCTRDNETLPFGRGKLNISEICEAASQVEAIVVELDVMKVTTPLEAVRESFEYMVKNKLGHGK